MKLNLTYKCKRYQQRVIPGPTFLDITGADPIEMESIPYQYNSHRGMQNDSLYFLECPEDGFYPLEGEFVSFSVPSRKGAVGRVIGLKATDGFHHSRYNETVFNSFRVVVRFDAEDKEISFDDYQLESTDATETNYQYHQSAQPKYESIESNYGQQVAVGDYVVGIKARQLYFGTVIKINPKSVRTEPFKMKGNGENKTVTLAISDLLKIERDIDIESQVALMMLTSL